MRPTGAPGHGAADPAPTATAGPAVPAGFVAGLPGAPAGRAARWSGDGWLLLRGDFLSRAPNGPRYGGSQIGAVLRYRVAPHAPYPLSVYLRTDRALANRWGDAAAGAALGLGASRSAMVYAEARAVADPGRVRVRPVIGLVLSPTPRGLPLGLAAAAYAHAGWAGGTAPTGFAEGQVLIDRQLATDAGDDGPRGGVGLWAAGQRGASRLDLGPALSATIRPARGIGVRIEADWRVRIAGRAQPGSGPALVIGASF
jgi:hypothetical protein